MHSVQSLGRLVSCENSVGMSTILLTKKLDMLLAIFNILKEKPHRESLGFLRGVRSG